MFSLSDIFLIANKQISRFHNYMQYTCLQIIGGNHLWSSCDYNLFTLLEQIYYEYFVELTLNLVVFCNNGTNGCFLLDWISEIICIGLLPDT